VSLTRTARWARWPMAVAAALALALPGGTAQPGPPPRAAFTAAQLAADAPTPLLQAGETMYADSGGRCTAGLNVQSAGTDYVLTAGHCTTGATTWFTDSSLSTAIGPTAATSFPADDYGLVEYANPDVPHPGSVFCNDAPVDITGAIDARVGMSVSFAGAISGCRTGTVVGLNATVSYGGDVVDGLIETDICTEPGDSGGLLFAGDQAIGLLSGGTGNCATGGASYFQPIPEALAALGLEVT
jgi:streptogrisin B